VSRYIDEHRGRFGVEPICRTLDVSASATMDLSAFYGVYRADGHGRPAHDPATMVALLGCRYVRGQRSSRVIERGCFEEGLYAVQSKPTLTNVFN
jgi:transposase